MTIEKNITYGDKSCHVFDAYIPEQDQGKKPMVLLIHGGGFENGDKEQPFYVTMSREIARNGYPAACLNYTLSNPAVCPALKALETAAGDIAAAIGYIQRHAVLKGLARNGIVLLGDSAAGAIVVKLSLDYGKAVGIVGCVDLWGGMRSESASTPWGGEVYSGPIDPSRAPVFLILHGTADSIAGYEVSLSLKEKLDRQAVPNVLLPLEGAEHYPEEHVGEILQYVILFLRQITGCKSVFDAGLCDGDNDRYSIFY